MMVTRTLCALFVLFAGVALAQPQFEPVVVNRFSLNSPHDEAPAFPHAQQVKYVPRGGVSDESTVMVRHEDGPDMRFREKGPISWVKDKVNKLKTSAGQFARKIADKWDPLKAPSGSGGSAGSSAGASTAGKRPEDIEDCTACRFVWLQVEMQVGNSQIEENIYDAFTQACIEAQKAPIFYPACEDMFDDVYGMIGDYMDGYTVSQVCEGAKMCR